jgi:hypothetical protein
MPALVDGLWLNQYVSPQLLKEFKNYKADFMATLKPAPLAAISADGIRMHKLVNNVELLINNADPFVASKMDGKKVIIGWDKLDTTPTSVDDAEARSLPFDKRSAVRMKHTESFQLGSRNYVMQKLAPAANSATTPVLRTTGADDGTGRLRLTYADLIKFHAAVKALNLPNANELFLILCAEHSQDLILDRASTQNNRDIVIDTTTGKLKRFYEIKLFENNYNPKYAANGTLKALGAVAAADDKNASIFYYAPNTVWHVNKVKILYKPETTDTMSADPTSEFRTQTYALCEKTQEHGFGAIVSGNVA